MAQRLIFTSSNAEIMKRIATVLVLSFCLSAINAQKAFEKKVDSIALTLSAIPRVSFEPFTEGERLDYLVHYGFLDAGVASIEVKRGQKTVQGKPVYHVVGTGKSTGAFNWFFKVNDIYESYIDKAELFPYVFKRDISEGGYEFQQRYEFEQLDQKVKTHKGKEFKVPTGVQDMMSAYYFARSIDISKYNVGDVIEFQAFVDDKLEPLKIRYVGRETIEIKSGTYKCLKFQPLVQAGRVFNDPEDLTVFITDDQNRIPVLAKANVLVGSIKMELTNYQGIAHPLAKK